MLRISLIFALIGFGALLLTDLSISSLDPWQELGLMAKGMLTPGLPPAGVLFSALLNTISFALIGIVLAVLSGSVLALFFDRLLVRTFCSFIRSVHELFWAFLLIPLTGLNPVCGMLAIAIPYGGTFAKVYAEIAQEAQSRPREDLPPATPRLSVFAYTLLPLIYRDLKGYTAYRFECALRSSAVLGFIGLPTLGYHLETAFREGLYSEAAGLLYCFYLLILSLKFWARPRLIPVLLLLAVILSSWETSLSLANISRFFGYDIIPWPMRAEGYYEGSRLIHFDAAQTLLWLKELLATEALPGLWISILLTQSALVLTALFALLAFPFASRHIYGRFGRSVSHVVLVVLRTTPEYILAYIFLQLWGPSALPALVALLLHNGAILAFLESGKADRIELPFDASVGRINRYLFEILPRSYGQFLAFLFYRWEVIMRESAILGLVGIQTLGFYIDSAISLDHLDTALVLITVTALCNMAIDGCSQVIRQRLRISTRLLSASHR